MTKMVHKIPAKKVQKGKEIAQPQIIRLAAYARVSSDEEDQLNSFKNQVAHYRSYCDTRPGYTLVDVYADEGISGTDALKRSEFMRMIADCEAGRIDMVIVKSVSRFARNTQDCLFYSRKLKALNIPVIFETENINTLDNTGELLFTILSSLAQDESRHISENTTWGFRARFKQGHFVLNTNRFMGYDRDADGKLVINPEQAVIVRRVFTDFMAGKDPGVIARELNNEGVPGAMGKPAWNAATVCFILKNEKHKGDILMQKWITPDYLTHKMKRNEGEVEQYLIEDNHEAIIDRTLWEAAQQELQRRETFRDEHDLHNLGRYTDEQPFSHRVFCTHCGKVYARRTWYRHSGSRKVWICANRTYGKSGPGCQSENLKEDDLNNAFIAAWNTILVTRNEREGAWQAVATGDDALAAFRAKQMILLTADPTPLQKLDCKLVAGVLERVEVGDHGILTFHFLDGSTVRIATKEQADGGVGQ